MTALRIILGLVTLFICFPIANAASIQCKRSSTEAEKLICSDPDLLRLDQDLNSAYNSALANAVERYKERVRESQKDWNSWRNELVEARIVENRDPGLDQLFRERISELQRANVKINHLAFLRLAGDQRPMYLLTGLPGTEKYNLWVERKWREVTTENKNAENLNIRANCQPDCEPPVLVWRVFTLDFASPEIISVHETIVSDSGGAHPSNKDVHHNWWLSRSGTIVPSEIFDGTNYLKVIDQYVARFLKDKQADYITSKQWKMAANEARKPVNWGIRADTLHVTGQGYEYGMGRGFVEIDIPWHVFGRGLRPDFKARLKSHKGAITAYQ